MLIHATKPLFAWEELDDSPTLQDIKQLLAALPDAKLLESLRIARGKGRDDYPVRVLWGVEILRIALRHVHMEDCLAELHRNAGKEYGKTVRVLQETDLRRFPSLPRATKKFESLYKGRTSIERVNARLKLFWGVDDGNVNGAKRFTAQVGMVLIVHLAFATLLAAAPRYEGTKRPKTLGQTRLSTIAKALRAASPA